jgi:hypothetical protein
MVAAVPTVMKKLASINELDAKEIKLLELAAVHTSGWATAIKLSFWRSNDSSSSYFVKVGVWAVRCQPSLLAFASSGPAWQLKTINGRLIACTSGLPFEGQSLSSQGGV